MTASSSAAISDRETASGLKKALLFVIRLAWRLVPGLVSLMSSLNEQKEMVKMALATCGIEDESLDDENIGDVEGRLVEAVNRLRAKMECLKAELEEEKKIIAALEEENEQLKKSISNF